MVDPERLKRAKKYAFENGMDIFDALDDIRSEEERHKYFRRPPLRPALPPRRPGEERNTRRYIHPPKLDPADIVSGFLRHVPVGSKLTGTRIRNGNALVQILPGLQNEHPTPKRFAE